MDRHFDPFSSPSLGDTMAFCPMPASQEWPANKCEERSQCGPGTLSTSGHLSLGSVGDSFQPKLDIVDAKPQLPQCFGPLPLGQTEAMHHRPPTSQSGSGSEKGSKSVMDTLGNQMRAMCDSLHLSNTDLLADCIERLNNVLRNAQELEPSGGQPTTPPTINKASPVAVTFSRIGTGAAVANIADSAVSNASSSEAYVLPSTAVSQDLSPTLAAPPTVTCSSKSEMPLVELFDAVSDVAMHLTALLEDRPLPKTTPLGAAIASTSAVPPPSLTVQPQTQQLGALTPFAPGSITGGNYMMMLNQMALGGMAPPQQQVIVSSNGGLFLAPAPTLLQPFQTMPFSLPTHQQNPQLPTTTPLLAPLSTKAVISIDTDALRFTFGVLIADFAFRLRALIVALGESEAPAISITDVITTIDQLEDTCRKIGVHMRSTKHVAVREANSQQLGSQPEKGTPPQERGREAALVRSTVDTIGEAKVRNVQRVLLRINDERLRRKSIDDIRREIAALERDVAEIHLKFEGADNVSEGDEGMTAMSFSIRLVREKSYSLRCKLSTDPPVVVAPQPGTSTTLSPPPSLEGLEAVAVASNGSFNKSKIAALASQWVQIANRNRQSNPNPRVGDAFPNPETHTLLITSFPELPTKRMNAATIGVLLDHIVTIAGSIHRPAHVTMESHSYAGLWVPNADCTTWLTAAGHIRNSRPEDLNGGKSIPTHLLPLLDGMVTCVFVPQLQMNYGLNPIRPNNVNDFWQMHISSRAAISPSKLTLITFAIGHLIGCIPGYVEHIAQKRSMAPSVQNDSLPNKTALNVWVPNNGKDLWMQWSEEVQCCMDQQGDVLAVIRSSNQNQTTASSDVNRAPHGALLYGMEEVVVARKKNRTRCGGDLATRMVLDGDRRQSGGPPLPFTFPTGDFGHFPQRGSNEGMRYFPGQQFK